MDYSTSISTSYADTYDKTSSQLSDKLTSTDFSQSSDDELMSVCKDFESYMQMMTTTHLYSAVWHLFQAVRIRL